jgi:phosphatidylserine decarboxylase
VIVLDGIYYAAAFLAAGGLVTWLAGPWFAAPACILALFCLNFFRDPNREIPAGPVAVSPADGKVVAVKAESPTLQRISIFLNIFDVHVNRTPIPGVIRDVHYREGKFHVASREECSEANEQNIITVLIARRIVCRKKAGDEVAAGERVGLIKFGSRVDVLLGPEWEIVVQPGVRVAAGSSILARRRDRTQQ